MPNNPFLGYGQGGGVYTPGNLTTKGGLRNALGNQFGQNAIMQGQQYGQRQGESGTLLGGYGSLLDSGYSPEQKSAINQSTLGAINTSFGGAQQEAGRRMARTGNAAGYGSFLGATARGKGQALAQQNLQNQKDFADETLRRKMMGLQGISQMYGVDTSFLNALGNQQLNTLNIGSGVESRRRGILGNIAAGGQAASSVLGL